MKSKPFTNRDKDIIERVLCEDGDAAWEAFERCIAERQKLIADIKEIASHSPTGIKRRLLSILPEEQK